MTQQWDFFCFALEELLQVYESYKDTYCSAVSNSEKAKAT